MSHIFINMPCFMPSNGTYLSFLFSATNLQGKAFIYYRPTLNLSAMQETGFNLWVGKIPWRRERLPTPVFWPGEFHGIWSRGSQRVRHDWATFTFFFQVTSAQIVRYYQYHQVLQTVLKTFAIHAFTITGWYHYLFFCSQYYYAS